MKHISNKDFQKQIKEIRYALVCFAGAILILGILVMIK